jgi:predicted O-methyltransferase YrrM
MPYYYFLAGLVDLTGAQRIVEIGTHQGGSARAMAAALRRGQSKIVTFDITGEGVMRIGRHPIIKPYQCDANSPAARLICEREFPEGKIDFAFIDTAHEFAPTIASFVLCAEILAADFIVLDDITLNLEMAKAWNRIRERYGDANTIDASALIPEIRPPGDTRPGFGVVRLTQSRRRGRKPSSLLTAP